VVEAHLCKVQTVESMHGVMPAALLVTGGPLIPVCVNSPFILQYYIILYYNLK
jgi:hypothetical protein